mgnify:CR=1 FL=1
MENRNHVRLVATTPVLLYVDGHGRVKGILQDVSQSGVAVQLAEQSDHLFAEGDEIFMLASNMDEAFAMKIIRINCGLIGLTFIE